MKTADTTTKNTSHARRVFCWVVWLPYALAVFCVWGFVFDVQAGWGRDPAVQHHLMSWVQQCRELFILAGLTIVGPLVLFYAVRVMFVYVASGRKSGRKLASRADRCPQCGYTLPEAGTQMCPECGRTWTEADRVRPSVLMRTIKDMAWLRRFTLACIVGFVGGPALAMLETALVRHFAERAFAMPPPTSDSVPKVTAKDYVSGWVDAEYLYSDQPGGRLYWSPGYWKHVDYYANRQPQIFRPSFRIVPWFGMGAKFAQPWGRVFVDFD